MTHPHDPGSRHDDQPAARADETAEGQPLAAPASGDESRGERRPQVSMHPRPRLRRLGRGAVALAAIAVIVLLSTLTLRFARRSVDVIAAEAPPAPVASQPLALQRIEEMRARVPTPPPPADRSLAQPAPAPPPLPRPPRTREQADHRAAWRAPLTHRTSARTGAAGASAAGPVTGGPAAIDPMLSPDLAASLRALAAAPPLAGSPAAASVAAPPPPAAGPPSHPGRRKAHPPSPPNLLSTPPTATTRWADPAAPPSPYLLRAGTLLPAVLAQHVVSDQPGLVRAVVARDVRDSLAGAHVLVPRGSVLLGRQAALPGFCQGRLAVVWTRLLFPDGRALDLDTAGGSPAASASRDGTAGLSGRVRHHWGRRYAAAALLSLVGAGVQLSQPQSGSLLEPDSPGAEAAGALGRELGRTSADILRRYADLPPTIELSPGARVHAVLLEDLAFTSPYPTFR